MVDDCGDVAAFIVELCMKWGYSTTTAYDGIQAIEKAKEFRPDCIVMDIVMPKMDGFDAAVEILRFQPNCQFVFMSGSEENRALMDEYRARGHDFQVFLPKPFVVRDLRVALGHAVYFSGE